MEWKYAQQKDPSRLLIDYNKLKQDNVRLEWEYNKLSRTHEISITEAIIERHTLKCEAIEFKENARHAKEQHIIAQASLEILTLENRLLTTESNLLQQEIKKLTEENFNLEEELDKLKVLYENACEKFSLLNQQKDSFAKKYIESQQIKSLDSEEKESLLDKLKLINEQLNQQVQEKENLQLCIDQLRTENKNLVSELKVENEQLQHQLEDAKTKTSSLSSENEILTKKIDELTKVVEKIRSEHDIIATARNELQGTLNYITNDNNKLRKETNELHVKIALLQNSCAKFNDGGPLPEPMNDNEVTRIDSVTDASSENSSNQSKRHVTFAETETNKKRVRVNKEETLKAGHKSRSNRSKKAISKMPDTTEPPTVIAFPLEPVTKNPVIGYDQMKSRFNIPKKD